MFLNDFEQDLLQFTGAVNSMLERSLDVVDQAEIKSADSDRLSNLLIGLKEYVSCSENDLCERLEEFIRQGYATGMRGTVEIDENGAIQLPKYVVKLLGWKPGDVLSWENNSNGSVSVRSLG
jgi:hypothetical protein